MFGQSAFAGYIAGQFAGGVCKLFGVDERVKRSLQMAACSVVGNATAVVTLDPVGLVLTDVQAVNYLFAKDPSSSVVTASVGLLGALSGQSQPHNASHKS